MARKKNNNNRALSRPNQPSIPPARPSNTPPSFLQHTQTTYLNYQGELPPPQLLYDFDQIIPNGADRYMTLVEKQATHRQQIEKKVIYSGSFRETLGVICALVIALAGTAGAVYTISTGHDVAGAALFGATLVALVTAFITGTVSQRKEREEKAKAEENDVENKPKNTNPNPNTNDPNDKLIEAPEINSTL